MSEVELDYWKEWIPKITERLTLILIKAQNGRDISEDDYELLRVLFKIYDNGELPLYRSKPNIAAEIAVQNDLFSADMSDSGGGIDIEYTATD